MPPSEYVPSASPILGLDPTASSPAQDNPVALPNSITETLSALLRGINPLNSPASRPSETFVTQDPATQLMLDRARAIRDRAPVEHPVLITGPSGTGKELVARLCARVGREFIAVNVACIPETLLASTLFGHVKGAFTGASDNYKGAFVAAGQGTIFLDELGDMPEAQQPALLRVIQHRVVTPVGATAEIPIHCRIVAATNQPRQIRPDLRGRFMYELKLSPLSQRARDRYLIGEHFGLTQTEVDAISHAELETYNARAIQQAAAIKQLGI